MAPLLCILMNSSMTPPARPGGQRLAWFKITLECRLRGGIATDQGTSTMRPFRPSIYNADPALALALSEIRQGNVDGVL